MAFCPFCFIHIFTSPKCVSSALWPFDALILLFSVLHLAHLCLLLFYVFLQAIFPETPSLCVCRSSVLNFLSSPPFSVSDQSNVLQFYQQNCCNHSNSLNWQLGRLKLRQVYPAQKSSGSNERDLVQYNICVLADLRPACLLETTLL